MGSQTLAQCRPLAVLLVVFILLNFPHLGSESPAFYDTIVTHYKILARVVVNLDKKVCRHNLLQCRAQQRESRKTGSLVITTLP